MDAVFQNAPPVLGKNAVSVPGHAVRRCRHLMGEICRHRLQVLQGHRLGTQAGFFLKAVGVAVNAQQEAKAHVDGDAHTHRPQHGAVSPPQSPPAPALHHGGNAPDQIHGGENHQKHAQRLRHGEVHPVAHGTDGPAQRRRHMGRQGVHPRPVAPAKPIGCQQTEVRQQPDMEFFVGFQELHGLTPRRQAAAGYTPPGDGQKCRPRCPAPRCGPASLPGPGRTAGTPRSDHGR